MQRDYIICSIKEGGLHVSGRFIRVLLGAPGEVLPRYGLHQNHNIRESQRFLTYHRGNTMILTFVGSRTVARNAWYHASFPKMEDSSAYKSPFQMLAFKMPPDLDRFRLYSPEIALTSSSPIPKQVPQPGVTRFRTA